MKRKWKLGSKGMTLLEVIVAFAIFAIAATILMVGFNGALKVMGNSKAINDASQENAGKLNANGATALENLESLKNSKITTIPENATQNTLLTFGNYAISGKYYIATSTERENMSLKMFQPKNSDLETPTLSAVPVKAWAKPDAPVIPSQGGAVAYNDGFISGNGILLTQKPATDPNKTVWITTGVNTEPLNFSIPGKNNQYQGNLSDFDVNAKNEHKRQLYFADTKNKGIAFTLADNDRGAFTKVTFDLDFLYINGSIQDKTKLGSQFILQNKLSPKDSNKGEVLVYFARTTDISKLNKKIGTIPKGYYLVPNEFDLLKETNIDQIKNYSLDKEVDYKKQNQIVEDYLTQLFNK